VKDKCGAMNAVSPVADAGGAQAGVILRNRQVGASPRCADNAVLQLMVHTASTSIFFGADETSRTSDLLIKKPFLIFNNYIIQPLTALVETETNVILAVSYVIRSQLWHKFGTRIFL
jgi:hypothetical protein